MANSDTTIKDRTAAHEDAHDFTCFGHFDGVCVCRHDELCAQQSLIAHAALRAAGAYIEMTAFAGGTIICTAWCDDITRNLFDAALRTRFPNAQIAAQHRLAEPGQWCSFVRASGDVREALTVEECELWLAIFGPKDDDPKGQPPPEEPPADGDDTQPMPIFEYPIDEPYEAPAANTPAAGAQPFLTNTLPALMLPVTRNSDGEITGLHGLPTEAWRIQMCDALRRGDISEAMLLTEIQVQAEAIAAPYTRLIQGNIAAFCARRIAEVDVA